MRRISLLLGVCLVIGIGMLKSSTYDGPFSSASSRSTVSEDAKAGPTSESTNQSALAKKDQAKNCGVMETWTSYSSGKCSDGKQYWSQRRKYKGCGLCTYYTYIEIQLAGSVWDPTWNCEASKHYAPASETGACFDAEKDNCK